jgi:hypothetical protein
VKITENGLIDDESEEEQPAKMKDSIVKKLISMNSEMRSFTENLESRINNSYYKKVTE